jgi:hypothetical protein
MGVFSMDMLTANILLYQKQETGWQLNKINSNITNDRKKQLRALRKEG